MNLANTRNSTLIVLGVLIGMFLAVAAAFIYMGIGNTSASNVVSPFDGVTSTGRSTAPTESIEEAESPKTLPELDEIVQLLQSSSSFERPVVLYDLMIQADKNHLEKITLQLGEIDNESISNEVLLAVFRRLADIDPSYSLSMVANLSNHQKYQVTKVIFETWAYSDSSGAIDHAKELDDEGRTAAIEGIFDSRLNLSDHELLDIASQLGDRQRALDEIAFRTAKNSLGDLSEDWTQTLAVHGNDVALQSDLQKQLIVDVATTYVKQFGADALQEVLTTLPHRKSRIYVVSRLLEKMAVDDPSIALDLATSVVSLDRDVLESVVRNWAEMDGLRAFNAAREVDAGGNRMQRAALNAWADSDPDSLLEKLDRVPENLQSQAMQRALQSIARSEPMSAIERLDGIEDDGVRSRVVRTLVDSWSDEDPRGAFEWSKSNASSEVQMLSLQSMILRKVVHTDPELAIEMALAEDTIESDVGLEAQVIKELSLVNLDDAVSMLDKVRNSATRTAVHSSIGTALVRQGKFDKAINLVQEESLRFQRGYFLELSYAWVETDYEDLLDRLDDLPQDEQLLMNVSITLASEHWRKAISLSPKQKELVGKYLPEMMRDSYLE